MSDINNIENFSIILKNISESASMFLRCYFLSFSFEMMRAELIYVDITSYISKNVWKRKIRRKNQQEKMLKFTLTKKG